MADKSYDELINESFALINKAANTTDAIAKKKLIDQAKTLKVQAEAIPLSVRKTQKETKARAEAAITGKQNYDAAQKELKRLRALPSTTPGLAASINVAESKVNKFKQFATVTLATGSKPPIVTPKVVGSGSPTILTGNAATAAAAAAKAAAAKAAADKAAADKAAAAKIKASQDAVKVQWINNMKVAISTIKDEKEKNEIISVLDRAVKEQWAKEDVYTQLQTNSTWWQKNSASYKNWYLFANDPSRAQEYKDTLGSTSVSITNSLETLGIKLNQMGPDGKLITQDKIDALINGMSVDLVRQGITASGDGFNDYMATNANIIFTGGGEIGSSFDKIKMQAMRYGIDLNNPTYAKQINYSLLDPNDGKDLQYYLKEMQTQSADLYPMFATSINSGRSLYEITNNYRNQMAGLFEVDPSNITWGDLMGKVINKTTTKEGNQVANTFADFTKLVKQDPLWQTTKNAKETYSGMAVDLMKQFGFMG